MVGQHVPDVPGIWLLGRLGLGGVGPLGPGLPLAASGLVLLGIIAAVLLLVGLDQLLDRGLLEQEQEQEQELIT